MTRGCHASGHSDSHNSTQGNHAAPPGRAGSEGANPEQHVPARHSAQTGGMTAMAVAIGLAGYSVALSAIAKEERAEQDAQHQLAGGVGVVACVARGSGCNRGGATHSFRDLVAVQWALGINDKRDEADGDRWRLQRVDGVLAQVFAVRMRGRLGGVVVRLCELRDLQQPVVHLPQGVVVVLGQHGMGAVVFAWRG